MLFAYPRTGSYLLRSLLDSAKDIVCHGEIFKSNRVELGQWHLNKLGDPTPAQRDADPLGFVDNLLALNKDEIVGFKAFFEHLNKTDAKILLTDPEWKKVVLFRDPIEVYASILRAREVKVWVINRPNVKPQVNIPVTFTPDSWNDFRVSYSVFLKMAENLNDACFIRYDQLHDHNALRRVLSYLGSTALPQRLEAGTSKQFTTSDIEEGFTNWTDLTQHLEVAPAPSIQKLMEKSAFQVLGRSNEHWIRKIEKGAAKMLRRLL